MLNQLSLISAQKRHTEHYLRLLEKLNTQYLVGGDAALQAVQKFREYIPQINHARHWALDFSADPDIAMYIIQFNEVSRNLLPVCLSSRQLVEWGLLAFNISNDWSKSRERMRSALMVANAYLRLNEYEEAVPFLEIGKTLAEEFNDNTQLVEVYNLFGIMYVFQSDPRSVDYFEKALLIAETMDDENTYIKALGNLGVAYRRANRYADAAKCMQATLELSIAKEDLHGQSIDLINLGELYLITDDYESAAEYLEKSLTINEQLDNGRGIGLSHLNLGLTYTRLENYTDAYDHLQCAHDYFQEVQNLSLLASVCSILGEWYLNQKLYDDAENQFEESLQLRQLCNDRVDEATSWQYLGKTYLATGNYERALDYFTTAIEINEETSQTASIAGVYEDMASTYEAQANHQSALACWRQAHAIYHQLGDEFAKQINHAEQEITRLRSTQ